MVISWFVLEVIVWLTNAPISTKQTLQTLNTKTNTTSEVGNPNPGLRWYHTLHVKFDLLV